MYGYLQSRKTPKNQLPDKIPYTTYWPHSKPVNECGINWMANEYILCLSIDPGTVNYAIRIEKRWTPNSKQPGKIEVVVFQKYRFDSTPSMKEGNMVILYRDIIDKLEGYRDLLCELHLAVVERQMAVNYKATRIAQHTISYLHIILRDAPNKPYIIEISPKMKGDMLGVPKKLTPKELKIWTVQKIRELLIIRRDTDSINVMNYHSEKADDLADTVAQLEALFIYWKMEPITREIKTQITIEPQFDYINPNTGNGVSIEII